MAEKTPDDVGTTGHEWDGIEELNKPLPKWWLYVFYALTTALMAVAGWLAGLSWAFYLVLVAGAGAQAIWQVRTLDIDDGRDCLSKFKSNRLFGWLVLAAIIAGRVL